MVSKAVKIVAGLALLLLGFSLAYFWREELIVLLRGALGPILILLGIIALALVAD